MNNLKNTMVLFIGAVATVAMGIGVAQGLNETASVTIDQSTTVEVNTGDDFSQESFPCEEDEALMYAPQFGHDNVGCVHLDSI